MSTLEFDAPLDVVVKEFWADQRETSPVPVHETRDEAGTL